MTGAVPMVAGHIGRTYTFAEREPITSAPTVGRELGKRQSAQRFPVVPWSGGGRRFDSGGGLYIEPDQRKRSSGVVRVVLADLIPCGMRFEARRPIGGGVVLLTGTLLIQESAGPSRPCRMADAEHITEPQAGSVAVAAQVHHWRSDMGDQRCALRSAVCSPRPPGGAAEARPVAAHGPPRGGCGPGR